MPKVGFYAVRVGKKIGVYNSWEECKDQTHGYQNARYKRFNTLKAAEDFAFGAISSTPLLSNSKKRSPSGAKGKKRAHVEVEDESCWDVVYSDGACKGNGKPGSVAGVGVWWGHEDPRNIAERCPGEQTNNRAELIAILRVLETTPLSKTPLLIKTDSEYSINCFAKWIGNWMKNDWKTASGKDVKNEGVIRCIDLHLEIRSRRGQKVCLQHVKGHSGEVGNEGADYLANEGTLKPPIQDRNWKVLEAQLQDSIDPDTSSTALVVQGSVDKAGPIPFGIQRKMGEAGVPKLDRVHTPGTSGLESNSPAFSQVGKAVDQTSGNPGGDAMDFQVSSIQIPSGIPRLVGNAKIPALPVLESQQMEHRRLVPPLEVNVPPKQPVRLSRVFGEAVLSSHAQFLEDSHTNSSTQSPVKVLYAAPPLIPVPVEDVNFEDYVDCLVDNADLAQELSD